MIRKALIIDLDQFRRSVKAEDFEIPELPGLVLHVFFGDDPGWNILIRPFAVRPIIVALKVLTKLCLCGGDIKLRLILADDNTAAVMRAFEDELIGQGGKIYLIRAVPRAADKGDKILFAYLFGDIFSLWQNYVEGIINK